MGTIILIITLVFEAAFAAYCIITKSDQKRVRSFVRIGALAAFIIFLLLSVIRWGFIWYGLAALLLVWSALGAWTLIRNREDKGKSGARPIVLKAVAMLALVVIAVTPVLIFPPHRPVKMTGKYQVATLNATYTDKSRIETFSKTGGNRQVNVEFWYPKDGDSTYPLVVFSHGAFGMKGSDTSTFMELASNGYVVCSIDYPYYSLLTKDAGGHVVTIDPSFVQEVMGVNSGKYDEETAYKLEQKWIKLRTTDINFVLDTIIQHAKDAGAGKVYQAINTERIGLMGHSLGGEASAQVGRERNDIGAVIDLDADLGGEYRGYVNGKNVINDKIYPDPILIVYSDELWQRLARIADVNDVVASKKVTTSAPNAYEVHLAGTNHMSVTDLPLESPLLVTIINSTYRAVGGYEADPLAVIEKMNSLVLEFFNAFLKGEGSFTSAGTC